MDIISGNYSNMTYTNIIYSGINILGVIYQTHRTLSFDKYDVYLANRILLK